MRYRKRPVEIEAFKYDGDLQKEDGRWYAPKWAREAFEKGILYYAGANHLTDPLDDSPPTELYIRTLEGDHHASVGDYIICGVDGELYPCKPDIFERTYEFAGVEENKLTW